jgi:asparagine synthase (glutamine-hydrolysing)
VNSNVGFGHTLLRTTREAERESQPCTLDGDVWITADARVDRREELKAELVGRRRAGVTDATDPELILHAYHAWGEDCLDHLIGDFAFAIWEVRRRPFCQDHFGSAFFIRVGELFCITLNCVQYRRLRRTK